MDTTVAALAIGGPCDGRRLTFPSPDHVLRVVQLKNGRIEILKAVGDKLARTLGQYRYENGRGIWEPSDKDA